jgi:hypothetical protein
VLHPHSLPLTHGQHHAAACRKVPAAAANAPSPRNRRPVNARLDEDGFPVALDLQEPLVGAGGMAPDQVLGASEAEVGGGGCCLGPARRPAPPFAPHRRPSRSQDRPVRCPALSLLPPTTPLPSSKRATAHPLPVVLLQAAQIGALRAAVASYLPHDTGASASDQQPVGRLTPRGRHAAGQQGRCMQSSTKRNQLCCAASEDRPGTAIPRAAGGAGAAGGGRAQAHVCQRQVPGQVQAERQRRPVQALMDSEQASGSSPDGAQPTTVECLAGYRLSGSAATPWNGSTSTSRQGLAAGARHTRCGGSTGCGPAATRLLGAVDAVHCQALAARGPSCLEASTTLPWRVYVTWWYTSLPHCHAPMLRCALWYTRGQPHPGPQHCGTGQWYRPDGVKVGQAGCMLAADSGAAGVGGVGVVHRKRRAGMMRACWGAAAGSGGGRGAGRPGPPPRGPVVCTERLPPAGGRHAVRKIKEVPPPGQVCLGPSIRAPLPAGCGACSSKLSSVRAAAPRPATVSYCTSASWWLPNVFSPL